jgi:ABC-type lipoprotein export system ATPase subunit
MPKYVKKISAIGVYGRYDFQMDFAPGINIVHGVNGSGKTTLLHILANLLNGKYYRFVFLPFKSITVELDDDSTITLSAQVTDEVRHLIVKTDGDLILRLPVKRTQSLLTTERPSHRTFLWSDSRRLRRVENIPDRKSVLKKLEQLEECEFPESIEPPLSAAYFPAFRTMIDAWASIPEDSERVRSGSWSSRATFFAREWFGEFTPPVNYPSLLEIENKLSGEVQSARITIGRADRKFLSEAFLEIFESLSEQKEKDIGDAEAILQEIRSLFDELEDSPLQEESILVTSVYAKLSESIHDLHLAEESEQTAVRVLNVYREILEKVVEVQQDSFREIQQYLDSVNDFLENKELVVDPSVPRFQGKSVGIQFAQGDLIHRLRALSSGERQIATLIYAATHMSEQQIVLIDEPEISLHIDWQRRLISRMSEQVGERQIIACTHSPSIAADYEEFQKEIELKPTAEQLTLPEQTDSDEIEELPF